MQLSSLPSGQMSNEDADNCRSPMSEHCAVSLSSIDQLVALTQAHAATCSHPLLHMEQLCACPICSEQN